MARELTWAPGSAAVVDHMVRPGGPAVSSEARLLYLALFSYMGADGTAYPKVPTLAVGTGISPRSTRYKLTELEQAGLVQRQYQLRNRNTGQRVTYRLYPPWAPCKPCTVQEMQPAQNDTPTLQDLHTHPAPVAAMEVTHINNPLKLPNNIARSISPTGKRKQKLTGAKGTAIYEEEFVSVWATYPRRVNRTGALAKYTATRQKGATAEDLATATQHYAQACVGKEPQFILHAATFFGQQERWKDYLAQPAPESKGATKRGQSLSVMDPNAPRSKWEV